MSVRRPKRLRAPAPAALAASFFLITGCGPAREPDTMDRLVEDFVFSSLAMSPVAATGA